MATDTITLAGGCFWCTEAIFQRLKGVIKVTPGYSGGTLENPTYEQVCSGETGHAEAVQIEFNPQEITLDQLLDVFFHLHDPTTLNQQGADIGTQYRSAIFYNSESQKEIAMKKIAEVQNQAIYKNKIVTQLSSLKNFYEGESYHQNYYNQNSQAPYCRVVIDPKIKKLYKDFQEVIKN